jgi:hypothetical protein
MKSSYAIATLSLVVAGCAGALKVYDSQMHSIAGMPFRAAEVYVKQGLHGRLAKGGPCSSTAFVDIISIPTGAQYYVTATSSSFAKTAFHIKYTDSGTVAEVGLDSEPAAAESLKAANDLLKTVLPAIGVGAAVASTTAATETTLPACDAGEEAVTFEKLDEYIKRQQAPVRPETKK